MNIWNVILSKTNLPLNNLVFNKTIKGLFQFFFSLHPLSWNFFVNNCTKWLFSKPKKIMRRILNFFSFFLTVNYEVNLNEEKKIVYKNKIFFSFILSLKLSNGVILLENDNDFVFFVFFFLIFKFVIAVRLFWKNENWTFFYLSLCTAMCLQKGICFTSKIWSLFPKWQIL